MNDVLKLVIVGAGGLGREVLATAQACSEAGRGWEALGFLDSNRSLAGTNVGGAPVLGGDGWWRENRDPSVRFVCAIGDPEVRSKAIERLSSMDAAFASVIHPAVHVPDTVEIGVGSVIMAGTRFTTDAKVGAHVVMYLNCAVTHDVSVGDFCLIASGCNLSGGAVVETGAQLGSGVNVAPRRRIGAWAIVGAGSVVVKDIPANSTAVGNPCRVIEQR